MTRINIGDTLEAAFRSMYLEAAEAVTALKWPVIIIVMANLLSVALQLGGIGPISHPGIYWGVWGLGAVAGAVGMYGAAFNWQRYLLYRRFHAAQFSETSLQEQLLNKRFGKYVTFGILLSLPFFVAGGLFYWGISEEVDDALFLGGPVAFGLVTFLLLPVWKRFSLIWCATAAGHDGLTLMDCFRLGQGNGWRIVVADFVAMFVVVLSLFAIWLVLAIPLGLVTALLTAVFGPASIGVIAIVMAGVQAIAGALLLCIPAGILAFSYAQIHEGFNDPLREFIKDDDKAADETPEDRMQKMDVPGAPVEAAEKPAKKANEIAGAEAGASAKGQPIVYGRRKKH